MFNLADLVQQRAQGQLSPPLIATLPGFTLSALQPAQAVIEFEATTQHANPSTVMIIGASRGIGLELARQYAADGWRVHATTRALAQPGMLGALPARMVAALAMVAIAGRAFWPTLAPRVARS